MIDKHVGASDLLFDVIESYSLNESVAIERYVVITASPLLSTSKKTLEIPYFFSLTFLSK